MPSFKQVASKANKERKRAQGRTPAGRAYKATNPDIPEIPEPEPEPVMPIPDEELSRTARRRARARRKGGRSSSILTGGDSLGGY